MSSADLVRQANSVQSPSSSRSSLSTDRVAPPANARRNRAALRDYYGLAAAAPANLNGSEDDTTSNSDLDKEGFQPRSYVDNLLKTQGLEAILSVETGLVNDVRGIDGERKALVYDNYSKLIAATETIRRMRTNMDPMTPMTNTLAPAISYIADTATSLSASMKGRTDNTPVEASPSAEVLTVRWALDSPQRFRTLVSQGKREDAQAEFVTLSELLQKWQGVAGVEQLLSESKAALDP